MDSGGNNMENKKESTLSLGIKFKVGDVLRYNMSVAMKNVINQLVLLVGALSLIFFFYKMVTTGERVDVYIAKNIVFLIVPILIFMMIPWRVWKITLTQMQAPAFSGGVHYTFKTSGILLDLGEASEEMSWDAFVKIVEKKHDFRFYVNKVSAQIIPKHNMNQEQIKMLRSIIKEAAPERCELK